MLSNCPSCNAALTFDYTITKTVVCASCHSVMNVENHRMEKKFSSSAIPEDMTPLMIGTEGEYSDKKFIIKGRIRYQFSSGYSNHWALYFKDDKIAWLSESYGAYATFIPVNLTFTPSSIKEAKLGKTLTITNHKVLIISAKEVCIGYTLEGELPIIIEPSHSFSILEASSQFNEVVSVHLHPSNQMEVFQGRFMEFDDLNFKNIRDCNEWV